MSSGWFDYTEPSLTVPSHGGTRCVGCVHTSSGWLDFIEPTQLQRKQGAWGDNKACRVISHAVFDYTEPEPSHGEQGV